MSEEGTHRLSHFQRFNSVLLQMLRKTANSLTIFFFPPLRLGRVHSRRWRQLDAGQTEPANHRFRVFTNCRAPCKGINLFLQN